MQSVFGKKITILFSLIIISLYYSNLYFESIYSNVILAISILANFLLLLTISYRFNENKYNLIFIFSIILFFSITFYFRNNTIFEIFRFLFIVICLYFYANITKERLQLYQEAIKLLFNIFFPLLFFLFIATFLTNLPRTSVYFSNIAYLSVFFFFSMNFFIIEKKKLMIFLSFIGIILTFTKSVLIASIFLFFTIIKNKYLKFFVLVLFTCLTLFFVYEEIFDYSFFRHEIFEPYRFFQGFNRRDDYWLLAVENASVEPLGIDGLNNIIASLGFYNTSLHSVWFDNLIIYGYLNFGIYIFLLLKFFKLTLDNFGYYIIMSFLTVTPGGIGLYPHLFLYFMSYNNLKNDE